MAQPSVLPDTARPSLDDGDDERFAHYARKADIARAAVTGETITAICGKRFTPTRDPNRYPVCPSCAEIKAAASNAGNN
ncbi:MAG: DUF3039 domain-containing protein [Acidimicrobiia bacterium]